MSALYVLQLGVKIDKKSPDLRAGTFKNALFRFSGCVHQHREHDHEIILLRSLHEQIKYCL